jgi:hypothetical protein
MLILSGEMGLVVLSFTHFVQMILNRLDLPISLQFQFNKDHLLLCSSGNCLAAPGFLALLPQSRTLLLSEPAKARIGMYAADTFQFKVRICHQSFGSGRIRIEL